MWCIKWYVSWILLMFLIQTRQEISRDIKGKHIFFREDKWEMSYRFIHAQFYSQDISCAHGVTGLFDTWGIFFQISPTIIKLLLNRPVSMCVLSMYSGLGTYIFNNWTLVSLDTFIYYNCTLGTVFCTTPTFFFIKCVIWPQKKKPWIIAKLCDFFRWCCRCQQM